MAMGERTPLALLSGPASGRMAVAEAITNMVAADVQQLGDIKLSANWMAAAGHGSEDAVLYDTVRAVGEELCPVLGIAIPVGKDSMSMKTKWTARDNNGATKSREVVAPVSLIVSAFAVVADVRATLTPQLIPVESDVPGEAGSQLFLIDLGHGKARLGGSVLGHVYQHFAADCPDVEDATELVKFFKAVRQAAKGGFIAAYHDRSDGGLIVTLVEMALAGRQSVRINASTLVPNVTGPSRRAHVLSALFAEELGAVVQVASAHVESFLAVMKEHGLASAVAPIGSCFATDATKGDNHQPRLTVTGDHGEVLLERPLSALANLWHQTSYRMAALRDNPECAAEELETVCDMEDPGLSAHLSFAFPRPGVIGSLAASRARQAPSTGAVEAEAGKPSTTPIPPSMPLQLARVAILREQGVNGHMEMAMAFTRAGFEAVDVHMTDLLAGRVSLQRFRGLAAVGGFSYGDVLGAGEGWAKSILFHERTRQQFSEFFRRPDTFAVGMCNGCQMMSALKELIPGAERWPRFVRNRSEQFEARFLPVYIPGGDPGSRGDSSSDTAAKRQETKTRSVLLAPMAGSRLPIAIAHGEGRAVFPDTADQAAAAAELLAAGLVALQYVDNHGRPAGRYPFNPNGSAGAIAGVCSTDGRVTIVMPHPERVTRWAVNSYVPPSIQRAVTKVSETQASNIFTSGEGECGYELDEGPWMQLFHNARVWVDSVPSMASD